MSLSQSLVNNVILGVPKWKSDFTGLITPAGVAITFGSGTAIPGATGPSGASVTQAWIASTAEPLGAVVLQVLGGVTVWLIGASARTTNAAFDLSEASNWNYTGQSYVASFVPGSIVVQGMQLNFNGQVFQSNVTRITGAVFDATEQLQWSALSGGATIVAAWPVATAVVINSLYSTVVGAATVSMIASGAHTTAASFTLAEAGNWTYAAQSIVGAFVASVPVLAGFQIVNLGQTYEAASTRLTGATFDATEQANWTALSAGATAIGPWIANAVIVAGALVQQTIGGISCTLRSSSARTTTATYNSAEQAFWVLQSQQSIATTYPSAVLLIAGFKYSDGLNQYQFLANAASGAAFTASDWSKLTASASINAWTPLTALSANTAVTFPMGGVSITMRMASAARITNASFDTSEAANWMIISQSTIAAFPASTVLIGGFKCTSDGQTFQAISQHTSAATFTPAEYALWTPLAVAGAVQPFVGGVTVPQYAQNMIAMGGTVVTMFSSVAAHTSNATFDFAEAANWKLTGQSVIAPFAGTTLVLAGYQILTGGQLYQSSATRITTASFDATEQAFWTVLSAGSVPVQAVTATGAVLAWPSMVTIVSATATTQTLPDAILGKVGSAITFKNLGAGIVTVVPYGANTVSGAIPTLANGDSMTMQVSATGVVQVVAFRFGTAFSPNVLSPWVASTAILQYAERSLAVGGTTIGMVSGVAGTTGASFDITEAANWSYNGQTVVPAFTASIVILQGFQIVNAGQTYQANSTRTTGLTFDVTEQGNWTALSASLSGTRVNFSNFAANGVMGTAAATVDVGNVFTFTQTTASITVSLPTPTTATTHQTMMFECLPASTYAIMIAGADTITLNPGDSRQMQWNGVTWKVLSALNVAAEYGTYVYAGALVTPPASTTSATATDFMTFTLPSAGVWDVNYIVHAQWNLNGNGAALEAAVYTSANVMLANTELLCIYFFNNVASNLYGSGTGTGNVQITTTAATTFKVRVWNNYPSATAYAFSDNMGRSSVAWKKISGNAPVSGQSVEYVSAMLFAGQSTNMAVGDHIKFDTVMSGSVYLDNTSAYSSANNVASIGRFTLKANKAYRLDFGLGQVGGNEVEYGWFNADTGVLIGNTSIIANGTGTYVTGSALTTIFPASTVDTRVEIRFTNAGMVNFYSGNGGANRPTWATITQIGSSALFGMAAPLMSRVTASTSVAAVIGGATTVYVDATSGPLTVTLPLASASPQMVITVKKVDASANAVTVARAGTDTIDGAVSYAITAQFDANDFRADSQNTFWGVH